MKIVALSDTHMTHERALVPSCDLLLHGGDYSRRGTREELETFLRWFAAQPARHRVFIAGNHDFVCQAEPRLPYELAARFGVTYLCDQAYDVDGVRLWGSPWTPSFGSWAFQRARGADIARTWDLIPDDVQVLCTHGPPHGIGDKIWLGRHVGCEALRQRVEQLRPPVHVFGHIHEAHGEHTPPGSPTRSYNVATRSLVPLFPDADVTIIEL